MTTTRTAQVRRLHRVWSQALTAALQGNLEDDALNAAEYRASNDLIDAVEAADMNGTEWDPRGTVEANRWPVP